MLCEFSLYCNRVLMVTECTALVMIPPGSCSGSAGATAPLPASDLVLECTRRGAPREAGESFVTVTATASPFACFSKVSERYKY